jgi:trehalose 6-phosphate synthase/phosphatase
VQQYRAPEAWKSRVRPLLDHFVAITPRSFVEEKTGSLVWHYRGVDEVGGEHFGQTRARELHALLGELLTGEALAVDMAPMAVEVRSSDLRKSALLSLLLDRPSARGLMVAIGDDDRDEDLFGMMPSGSITIRVGLAGETRAIYRVEDPRAVRTLLWSLLEDPLEAGATAEAVEELFRAPSVTPIAPLAPGTPSSGERRPSAEALEVPVGK